VDQDAEGEVNDTQDYVQQIIAPQEGEKELASVTVTPKNPTTPAVGVEDFLGSMRTKEQEEENQQGKSTNKKAKKALTVLTRDEELEKFLNSVTIKDG